MWTRLQQLLANVDRRLRETGAYLAGHEVTAADTMSVFSLTTMRQFFAGELCGISEYCGVFVQDWPAGGVQEGDGEGG